MSTRAVTDKGAILAGMNFVVHVANKNCRKTEENQIKEKQNYFLMFTIYSEIPQTVLSGFEELVYPLLVVLILEPKILIH